MTEDLDKSLHPFLNNYANLLMGILTHLLNLCENIALFLEANLYIKHGMTSFFFYIHG